MAARATFDLNTGVWFRRGRLLMVSPVRGHHRRYQAETPLIPLSRFAEPALSPICYERQMSTRGHKLLIAIITAAICGILLYAAYQY
jgi:hypothetical protein